MTSFTKTNNAYFFTPWQQYGVYAGFTTREYTGENIPDDIALLAGEHHLPGSNFTFLHQKHGIDIHIANGITGEAFDGDGLITTQPGKWIIIKTADCVPVFLLDPKTHTACVLHCGWKSTNARIIPHALKILSHITHSPANTLEAAIGPCLRTECFEVQKDFLVHSLFTPYIANTPHGLRFNLAACVQQELTSCGILPTHIRDSGFCSICHNTEFYSYRVEKQKTCRTLSFMYIVEK